MFAFDSADDLLKIGEDPFLLDNTREEMGLDFGDDEGNVAQATKEKTKTLMRDGQDFVFNATNLIKDIRGKWIRLFRQYSYRITIHYVEKPLPVILKQNKQREQIVPEQVIEDKFDVMDIPTLLECHKLNIEL